MPVKDLLNSGLDKLNTTGNKKTANTDNDKAKEKGARTVNKTAPAATGFSVPERIWNFLTQEKGISSITTAAIMGNIFQESTYNPSAINPTSGAKGLCQWYQGRATKLDSFASSKGKQWTDIEAQLEYLWSEIGPGGYYNQFLNHMTKTYTQESQLDEAVEYWEKHFEVSGDTDSYPRRKTAAKEALQKQGKGIIAGGTYTPGSSPANGFIGQSSTAKRGIAPLENIGVERTGHKDEYRVKPLDPDKTFCEPIYPDLTSLGEEIPAYDMPKNVSTADMKPVDYNTAGAGLVYSLPTMTAVKLSDNKNLENYIVLNEARAQQRKELFEKAKARSAFKKPSAGKPPNNLDPFPVDHKIVELESHQPRCKIDSLVSCKHALEATKAVILLSTDVEKRLVRIENNMATMMRYLYRMAGRVNINCVYYGGQIPATYPVKGPNGENNKYCCIRCLKDDRIQEGKQVSLDQCLNCTRYEPLIGQVYDILSDSGDNLSAILDDNQMSYTTMDEYYKFRNLTERQTPMEAADLMTSDLGERNIAEMDLDDEWGPGLAMNWALYPVELQQPHTNPPVEGALASSYGVNSGMAMTNSGAIANMLIEARNQIDASDSKAKQVGSEYVQIHLDTVVSEVKAKLGSQIREYYQSKNITTGQDQCLVAALMSVYGGQIGDTIDKLEKAKADLKGRGVDNIVLHVMFYTLDKKYLFGEGADDKYPVRLDKVENVGKNKSTNSGEQENQEQTGLISWDNVSKWNWNEISKPLALNINGENTDKLPDSMLNFAKVVYLYKELVSKCSASRFDTAEWGFPFTEEQIASAAIGLNHPQNGEFNNFRGDHYHNGVDIGIGGGSWSKRHPEGSESKLMRQPVHAARDGIVSWLIPNGDPSGGGGGNCMGIQHDNGYSSCYMHLSAFAVQQNQKVSRGEVIGYTGGSGGSTLIDYDEHLHFEIRPNGQRTGIDPWSVYNGNLSSRPRPFQFRDINP